MLYPSELQPHALIVIRPGPLVSNCRSHGRQGVTPGGEAGGLGAGFIPGAIFAMRKLRKIVGQYSLAILAAPAKPMRIPYL